MKVRRTRWLSGLGPVLAVVVAAGPVGCARSVPQARSGASSTIPMLRVGEVNSYSTLDPNTTQACFGPSYCGLLWERLLTFGPDGKPRPNLATSVARPDRVTYVYHLRRGVKFWDGNEMTSADVVDSLNYQRTPESQTATHYANVKSIEATDKYTVVITLKKADESWQYTLAHKGVVFEKAFHDAHKSGLGKPGVLIQGTGPWKVDSFNPTTGMELSANPHWWGGPVPIKRISYKFFTDANGVALAMRSRGIDVAFPEDASTFRSTSGGAKVVSWPDNTITYFGMNVKLAPWNDIHVRRAVAYALNRADIIAANGGAEFFSPVDTIISTAEAPFGLRTLGTRKQVDALLQTIPRYGYDLAKAKQEMALSHYQNGFSARMDTFRFGKYPETLQVIAANLKEIGIKLDTKIIPAAKWIAEVYGPKTYALQFTGLHSSSPDPSGITSYLLGSENAKSGANFANYTPKQVDKWLAAAAAAADPAERLDGYGQILRQVATDVPYVPLFQGEAHIAFAKNFTSPALNASQSQLPWALRIKPVAR
jgi:peptide/nickel transport system substrate-binding protein